MTAPESERRAITFQDVITAINADDTLTPGVKANLRHSVERIAYLLSPAGLAATVDIPAISKQFARLSAARLGLKSPGSLAALKSNLRRALRLAGVGVMPGRHVTPFSDAWGQLLARIEDRSIRTRLSRFAHVASEQGWHPAEIGTEHIKRFREIMLATNLGSKTEKVLRNTANAWRTAQKTVPGWPAQDIGRPPGSDHFYSLPWSAFPASLEEDVRRFLDRPGGDWLDLDTSDRRPLRPRTIKNYEDAYRRAASILVIRGTPGGNIQTIADLVTITAVQTVLRFLMERTKRKDGGIVAYMAFALYFAAKEHVGVKPCEHKRLEQIWRRLREPCGEMSHRTFERLLQFDDPAAMQAVAGFPHELAQLALKRKTVDARAIKLMRTALFLAIALDTALRARNLVSIEIDRHLALFQEGKKWKARLSVPGDEVKNGVDIVGELTPLTVQILRRWLADFRPAACAIDCNWLFPAGTGGHLSGGHAYQDVKDLALRHLGLDVTPHLIRSFIGKAMLDERPDSHADIQQILGHRQIRTTLAYYAPVRPAQARRRYHESLGQLRGRS